MPDTDFLETEFGECTPDRYPDILRGAGIDPDDSYGKRYLEWLKKSKVNRYTIRPTDPVSFVIHLIKEDLGNTGKEHQASVETKREKKPSWYGPRT